MCLLRLSEIHPSAFDLYDFIDSRAMRRLAGGGTLLYPITARSGQSQAYSNYSERNILVLLFFWICFLHSDPRLCRGRLLLRRVRLLLDLPFLNCLWIPLWFAAGFCIHQFSSSIFLLTFFFNLYRLSIQSILFINMASFTATSAWTPFGRMTNSLISFW